MEIDSKLNVWIRGNDDNPQGVIKALEELGGKNTWGIMGIDGKSIHFIDNSGNIDCHYIDSVEAYCIMNTFKEIALEVILKDKQLVWAWDDDTAAGRNIGFYDAKNNCVFCLDGQRCGRDYCNYEPYEGEYPDWAKEAVKILEE